MRTPTLALALLLALAGTALADPIVIKIATVAPEGSPWAAALDSWKKDVESKAPGRVKVKVFKGGALGDENESLQATKRGQIQGVGATTGAIGTLVPEVNVLELPYLFNNEQEADYIIDHVIGDKLRQHFHDRGLIVGFWSENGFRSFGGKAPIHTVSDLKGKKMRSQENPIHIATYRAFGASPVPIPITETLTSLQTGVVDGFDNTLLYTFAASWQSAIKYFSLTQHIYQPAAIVFNRGQFESWPSDIQELVIQAGNRVVHDLRQQIRAMEPILIDNLKTAGVQVNTISAAELGSFQRAGEQVRFDYVGKATANEKALYNQITQGLKEFRARGGKK